MKKLKRLQTAELKVGESKISEYAKFALPDLANGMKTIFHIEGYTSVEKAKSFDQKLRENCGQATADFLIQYESIDSARLEVVGLGSS